MAVREIIQLGNPILWAECAPVESVGEDGLSALIRDLDDTLAAFRTANGFGRGIAAPQIGVTKRVIYVRMTDGSFDGPMINPQIVWQSDNRVELWDNCFSFPDLLVRVSRAERIRVTYGDLAGHTHLLDATGDLSELLQHEIDHLNGILAVDRALSPKAFATKAAWELMGRPR